jgi:hypothetical protein
VCGVLRLTSMLRRWLGAIAIRIQLWPFDRIIAVTGAALSLAALAAVIYFGLYPRPPVEAPLDPNTLYRGGAAIGHVTSFSVLPPNISPAGGEYRFQVEASKPIEVGDVLQFRYAACLVLALNHPGRPLPNNIILFEGIVCRVVSG